MYGGRKRQEMNQRVQKVLKVYTVMDAIPNSECHFQSMGICAWFLFCNTDLEMAEHLSIFDFIVPLQFSWNLWKLR